MKLTTLSLTTVIRPFNAYDVCLVAGGPPHRWRINSFSKSNEEACMNIATLADFCGARDIYAPYVRDCSARIAARGEFTEAIPLGDGSMTLYGHPGADGVILSKPGEAFYIAAADCPPLLIFDPATYRLAVAHAGRASLIDPRHVRNETSQRHRSVVDAMIAELAPADPSRLEAFIGPCISPWRFIHSFTDEHHGQSNRMLYDYLSVKFGYHWAELCMPPSPHGKTLNLRQVAAALLKSHGVTDIGFSHHDTHGETNAENEPLWYSHARDRGGEWEDRRNGFLVRLG